MLREPFVQFLILGALIFGLYTAFGSNPNAEGEVVVVDAAFVRGITEAWQAKRLRPPTPDELRSEIANRVRMEVLYREGVRRGFDQGDIIIKRRVAQKMEFLGEQLAGVSTADDHTLRAWFDAHPQRFVKPRTVTLRVMSFTGQRDGASAESRASAVHGELQAGEPTSPADTTNLPTRLTDADETMLRRTFGATFASAVLAVPEPGLLGALQTSFGWHVVEILAITPEAPQRFESVIDEVRSEQANEARLDAHERFYQAVRQHIDVRVDADAGPSLPADQL